jgi:hypothetical protein
MSILIISAIGSTRKCIALKFILQLQTKFINLLFKPVTFYFVSLPNFKLSTFSMTKPLMITNVKYAKNGEHKTV